MLGQADHPLGINEIVRGAGLHPGQQTLVKRLMRDMVRKGAVLKEGKRFRLPAPAATPKSRSGAPKQGRSSESRSSHARSPEAGPSAPRASEPRVSGPRASQPRTSPAPRSEGNASDIVEGTLSLHRDGYGFVEDVFLPPQEAAKALDGDRVRVRKIPSGRDRFEGRLLEVLSRRREQSIGIYQEEGDRAWVQSQDKALPRVRVPKTQLARPGDVVKVRLGVGSGQLGRDGLVGEVSGSLGRPGDPSQEVLSIVFGKGFSDEFPPAVMDDADRFPSEVPEEAATEPGRKDLRQLPLLTIDGADARDFDDAVYVGALPAGGWRLWVAIADVAHYVTPGTPLDDEAQRRGTSVYLPDRVLPMLPEHLSNGLCSLKPEEDRLCTVAEMDIDASGHTHRTDIYPAVMRSVARCTYEEVQGVLSGESIPHRDRFRPQFQQLASLAKTLNKMRSLRGALDFDLPEHKVKVGDDGRPVRIERRDRLESHRLIEACMLAANEAVASFFHERSVPTVYRFHAEPDPDKLAIFVSLAEAYGFQVDGKVDSTKLNAFMRTLAGHPEQRALNQLLLRSMMQAVYSSENAGHYGLGAEHYLHFTSPIRRYPDLLVHRLLKKLWAGGRTKLSEEEKERELERLELLAVHASEQERAAVQSEREVVSFYSALLMKDRVGEEFEGTVSSITDFGFFVELTEAMVEGLVKAGNLGAGSRLDMRRHALVFPSGRAVKVGQRLRVKLASVSVERRQIDLELLRFEGETGPVHAPGASATRAPVREQTYEMDAPVVSGSAHPGFDRLRSLAARTPKSDTVALAPRGAPTARSKQSKNDRGQRPRGGGGGKPKSGGGKSRANPFRGKR